MKNFLCLENINLTPNNESEILSKIIQSSSEMEGCPITNILDPDEKTLWLSTESLPQEIIINIGKNLFKEIPKKITGIGIYCWHAYPTNPKLIEIQISKNKGNYFKSLGNFDLCLKPGRQLLQLDDEIINDELIIKLIIKETFGDKRTYINNIYLYENINLCGKFFNKMETIKEEDSNSMVYLRESREKNFPQKNNLIFKDSLDNNNNIDNDNEDINNNNNKINKINNKNNEDSQSQSLISDSDLSEKYNKNNKKNIERYDNIEFNDDNINENENLIEMNKQLNLMLENEKDNDNDINSKEKSLNMNDFNNEEENENESDINEENLELLIEEFEKYKKIHKKRMINYENKIKNLEEEYKQMYNLNNKMKETINTIIESQIIQQNENHDYLLGTMKNIIYNKINNVFSNFNKLTYFNNINRYNNNNYYKRNNNYNDNIIKRIKNNKNIIKPKNINIENKMANIETNTSKKNNEQNNNQNDFQNYPLKLEAYPIINKNKSNFIINKENKDNKSKSIKK